MQVLNSTVGHWNSLDSSNKWKNGCALIPGHYVMSEIVFNWRESRMRFSQ